MSGLNFNGNPHIIKADNTGVQNRDSNSDLDEVTPRIIAVTSGKGGAGKTSLTVNLAIALSRAGNRVVILDADLGLANVEVMTGITPPLSLYDCLNGRAEIRDIIVPGPEGIKLISGGSGFMELANLSDRHLRGLIDSLSILDNEADYIIVDTSAGISKSVLAFIAAVQEVLMVINPEPTSITDAYSLAKIISRYKLQNEINLVINRVANSREASNTLSNFENVCLRYLNLPINYLGYILEDRAVSEAIKIQEPLILYKENSPTSKCIYKISENIASNNRDDRMGSRASMKEFTSILARLFRR